MSELKLTKYDYNKIAELLLNINEQQKKVIEIISENHDVLRHFAASAVHLAMFMRDLNWHKDGITKQYDRSEEMFLDHCGCRDEKNESK